MCRTGYGFAAGWGGKWDGRNRFFLKKQAKTFATGAAHGGGGRKSLLVLFFRKERLS
jgi:hypothetical protein